MCLAHALTRLKSAIPALPHLQRKQSAQLREIRLKSVIQNQRALQAPNNQSISSPSTSGPTRSNTSL